MSSKNPRAKSGPPPQADNFKRISGISRVVESRLHKEGILTFAQLAAQTPEELAEILGHLPDVSVESIISQGWIRKAFVLARQPGNAEALAAEDSERSQSRAEVAGLRDISFVVDLFLDDHDEVRRTRVLQVKSNEDAGWEGWDETRLIRFFADSSGLRLPSASHSVPLSSATKAAAEALPPTVAELPEPVARIEVLEADSGQATRLVNHSHSFDLAIRPDWAQLKIPPETQMTYQATILARNFDGHLREHLAQRSGTLSADETISVRIPGGRLPRGLYHFIAEVACCPVPFKLALTACQMPEISSRPVQIY